ncbi:four-carbon acid sugar kinase family protein [Arthrobacter sp. NPDC080031]|uniref:four-carbon acid sugar kinase family protein n=1 Tax=Arthrobacter sp. NPDC080031 TaxID=3155918 RepID=UPI003450C229
MVSRSSEVSSKARPGPRVCFYADDFTGASDALTQFTRFGLSSVLLFKLPSAELLSDHASRSDVLGIAGLARTLDKEDLRDELTPIFEVPD